jgi:hypothetical protein
MTKIRTNVYIDGFNIYYGRVNEFIQQALVIKVIRCYSLIRMKGELVIKVAVNHVNSKSQDARSDAEAK